LLGHLPSGLPGWFLSSFRAFFFSSQSLAVSFFPAVNIFVGAIDDVREKNRSVNRLCFFLSEINAGHSLPKQAYAKIRKSENPSLVFNYADLPHLVSTFQFQKTVENSVERHYLHNINLGSVLSLLCFH